MEKVCPSFSALTSSEIQGILRNFAVDLLGTIQSNEANVLEKTYILFLLSLNGAALFDKRHGSSYIVFPYNVSHSLSIMVSFFTPHSVSHQFSFSNYLRLRN